MKQHKTTNQSKKARNPLLRVGAVLCSFLSRIDKVHILNSEWSTKHKNWSLSFLSIGMWHEWDGKSNYSTKTFAWVSFYNNSWHCGLLFFKIA
jgi:hypothetical protein